MSTITKELQNVEKKVEEGVVEAGKKVKEVFTNVASHLPLANLGANKLSETFTIEVDLPGVKKEDINVSVEGNNLHVTAVRYLKEETKKEDYYLLESSYGKFARTFYLSDEIDKESIHANYDNGRLTLTLEKAPEKRRKEVSVN